MLFVRLDGTDYDFDLLTARHIARLSEVTYKQPVALPDLVIAATGVRHGLSVVTRNVRDFERLGVEIFDPTASPRGA